MSKLVGNIVHPGHETELTEEMMDILEEAKKVQRTIKRLGIRRVVLDPDLVPPIYVDEIIDKLINKVEELLRDKKMLIAKVVNLTPEE